MKILMFVTIFLILGLFFIVSNNNLHLGDVEEREILVDKYFSWIGNVFDNSVNITGHVVKLDWLP